MIVNIKMNYQNLKFAQVGILTAVSIYASSPFLFLATVAFALWNSPKYYLNLILGPLCALLPFASQLQQLQIQYLLPCLAMLALCWWQLKGEWEQGLSKQQQMRLTTLNGTTMTSRLQLSLFYIILILKVLHMQKAIDLMVVVLRVLLVVEAIMVSIIAWFLAEWGAQEIANRNWWYFAAFPLAILNASLLIGKQQPKRTSGSQLTFDSKEIEMEDLSQRFERLDSNLSADGSIIKDSRKQDVQDEDSAFERINNKNEEQSQSLNLFLVIPFCLLQQGWLEIPIYAYLIALEWGRSRKQMLAVVLVAAAFISANCQVGIQIDAILRVLAVLLVTKNLQGGYEIGQILKIIWLRSSFALVLSVLFWFALLTVNIFHLLFIAIILLFITKGAARKAETHSFRHRNWKYLLGVFNVFLVFRLLLTLGWIQEERWRQVMQLAGISYHYVSQTDLFNAVPLIINAIIGLQYLTYNSKIYSEHSQSTLFQNYRTMIASAMDILTVIYYKLLPWVSYLAILCLLLVLEPSLGACILLGWILITLGTHVLLKNQPSTYKRLFWLWLVYSRLTSLQIVLRYVFQFMKFDLLAFVRNVKVFQVLLQYQQLLGLAIRDQDTVYLKTVTKFQLMISLDLMAIFIAFLVTQYYSLLLKVSELPPIQEWGPEQRRVGQVFRRYVDFKLTQWLQRKGFYKAILMVCRFFFQLYFPLLGLFCCQHITILNGLYLMLVLRYFLALNYNYYKFYIRKHYGSHVLHIVLYWSDKKQQQQQKDKSPKDINYQLKLLGRQMAVCKVAKHGNLRLGFVIVTVIAVLFTYISGMLNDPQVLTIIDADTAVNVRWWLLVGGCSKECGLAGHFPKLMLFLLVLEMKCCWFIKKFQTIANKSPEQDQNQASIAMEVLTTEDPVEEEVNEDSEQMEAQEGRHFHSVALGESKRQKQAGEMQVSLLLACLKLLERSLVMVLVFISIVLGSHPFGIIYLLCAILLNYLGSVSANVLSKILSILLILEYLLCLSNYSNDQLYPPPSPQFSRFQQETLIHSILGLGTEWEWYVTFGKGVREMGMLSLSWILLAGYQLYFVALRKAWLSILALVQVKQHVGLIGKRMSAHLRQVYEHGLTYSPLLVMLLCLFIYLLDYTTTNMLLSLLTVGFIFVSFLVREYRESRHFWRTYFVVLQLLIVCFMLIYSLLQLPMLASFCNRLLCAAEELHTQIYKALLLLILQIGLDLTSSLHFHRALKQFDAHARHTDLQKLAIAYYHNDRKIEERFKHIKKRQELRQTVERVEHFLEECKQNPQLEYQRKETVGDGKQSWYDFILDIFPSLIDEHLLLSEHLAAHIVAEKNATWIKLKDIKQLNSNTITDLYIDDYGEIEGEELIQEVRTAITNTQDQAQLNQQEMEQLQIGQQEQNMENEQLASRRSFIDESQRVSSHMMVESLRQSARGEEENKQLLYLLLVESVLSNWHYLTYFALLQLHISNQGLLTLPIPLVVFCCGVVASYQAGKQVWRCLLLLVQLPLLFKFAVGVQLVMPSDDLVYLLAGDNMNSVFWEYICIVLIIGQCVILKMIGHYSENSEEVECMKMALVRNLLNRHLPQKREPLFVLLRESSRMPVSWWEMIVGRSQGKPGYDYSTLLTGLQLLVLVWVFLFYDKMAVRQQVTFYQMIEYNQFSSGMVALTLCQLFFLLVERFVAIVDLRGFSTKWQAGLAIKYALMLLNLLLVEGVALVYFPLSSGKYAGNGYVTVLLVLNMLALLVQALQIKQGLDQASRGFMDRYTWYNGFIYIGFRAIPFLFEFKAFSDWTFTRTALRIFDWIRLQEIFGRLYVAKCNALFLAGKQLGSKIEWWKKLLMGYPLLLSIILLLFGPLVLFSSLNPLASRNDVTAGYLQVILRINKTNEYPLYTNSHITDIHRLDNPTTDEQTLLTLYDIDPDTIQQLHLEQFSDQYWEISEGSYYKLLAEPQSSLHELLVRAKFDRNQTGLSSLYVLSTYELPQEEVPAFKQALLGKVTFCAKGLLPTFLRLDNNNGLHELGEETADACLKCTAGVRVSKQYWVLQGGLRLRVASDKYTKAIFGYSVMSFYISIILVIANYFRFLFQGTVHTIITSDIPHPDPALALCNAIFTARRDRDLQLEEALFWRLIDLLRSPDTLKALTGNYLQARLDTLKKEEAKSIKAD